MKTFNDFLESEGLTMKVYVFWRDRYDRTERKAYKGVVGGGMWDQFLVNARNGHGYCYLVDGINVASAKANLDRTASTSIPFVQVYGEKAKDVVRKAGGTTY